MGGRVHELFAPRTSGASATEWQEWECGSATDFSADVHGIRAKEDVDVKFLVAVIDAGFTIFGCLCGSLRL